MARPYASTVLFGRLLMELDPPLCLKPPFTASSQVESGGGTAHSPRLPEMSRRLADGVGLWSSWVPRNPQSETKLSSKMGLSSSIEVVQMGIFEVVIPQS